MRQVHITLKELEGLTLGRVLDQILNACTKERKRAIIILDDRIKGRMGDILRKVRAAHKVLNDKEIESAS